MMPKPPVGFCVDSFEYREFTGENSWSEPIYAKAITVKRCRIDRVAEYTTAGTGRQLLYNAIVFCYAGITEPLPAFKPESILIFGGQEHTITKVIPVYEAYKPVIYSYELEVI